MTWLTHASCPPSPSGSYEWSNPNSGSSITASTTTEASGSPHEMQWKRRNCRQGAGRCGSAWRCATMVEWMCHAMQATQKNEARKKNWFPMASRKQRSAAVCFEISLRRQRVC